jgi:hypothetical protein
MRNDAEDKVIVPLDLKVKAVAAVYPGLPDISGCIILFGFE